MAKSGFRIKLSSNMKPYVGRVVRGGAIQMAFKEHIGSKVGQCVKTALGGKKGLSSGQVHDAVRECKWPKGTGIPGWVKRVK